MIFLCSVQAGEYLVFSLLSADCTRLESVKKYLREDPTPCNDSEKLTTALSLENSWGIFQSLEWPFNWPRDICEKRFQEIQYIDEK